MRVEQVKPSDISEIVQMFINTSLDEYQKYIDKGLLEKYLNYEKLNEQFNAYCNNIDEIWFCIKTCNEITGFIEGKQDNDGRFEIKKLYTKKDYKRMGIGSKLITHLENEIEKRYVIYCWVIERNIKAQSFYKKNGYSETIHRRYLDRYNVNQILFEKTSY